MLRGSETTRAYTVWAVAINDIPMAKRVGCRMAIHRFGWPEFCPGGCPILWSACCVDALEETMGQEGGYDIFNTDQQGQSTAEVLTDVTWEKSSRGKIGKADVGIQRPIKSEEEK